jgi:hypothetical protein
MVIAQGDDDFVGKPVPTKTDADQGQTRLIGCVHESEVGGDAEGSIDIDFYKECAQRLRREATLTLCRLIREFIPPGSRT